MQNVVLGKTGLSVSVMGIGCGGPSRVGQKTGRTEAESVRIVRQAIDARINFIDTAEIYGTEEIVGKAIKDLQRDSVIISTKKSTFRNRISPDEVSTHLDESLKRLGTDYIDIYHLHGVLDEDYDYFRSDIIPVFEKSKEQGKIRYIGITEMFNRDPVHKMLNRALDDDVWDVMMVGFNMINQSARDKVLKKAIEKDIGILVMFAVRRALSNPEKLKSLVLDLVDKGQLDPKEIDVEDPFGFLVREDGAKSLQDAAYRFCRYEPGTHVILSGTGNDAHLQENVASFSRPQLPESDVAKVKHMFRMVDSVTGE